MASHLVDGVSSGQHALMQNTGNQNAAGLITIKHHVPAMLHATQAGTNIVTGSAQCGVIGKHLTTRLKIFNVARSLILAPGAKSIGAYAYQVVFGPAREAKERHG